MGSHAAPLRSSTPGRRGAGMEGGAARAQGYNVRERAMVQQQQQERVMMQQERAMVQQQQQERVMMQQERAMVQQERERAMAQQQGMAPRAAGPVAILWDIENCPVPVEVNAEDVASNMRVALRGHPNMGAVTMFSAYGDFNHFPKKVREGCQRTGVNLIDVPNGKKDAADKAILVDMFLFALDNPPPSTIFLVTGDVDFAPALHKLSQRGYCVVLVIPDGVGVSPALRGAGHYVWDWPSLCRGQGLVEVAPTARRRANAHPLYGEPPAPYSEFDQPRAPAADDDDHVYGEEILVQRKVAYGTPSFDYGPPPFVPPVRTLRAGGSVASTSPLLRSPAFAPRAPIPTPDADLGFAPSEPAPAEPTSPGGHWVQPGDLVGLKKQLARLVNQHGGKISLVKVAPEYNKCFGRPLYLSEYNVPKLVHLVEKMKDMFVLKGDGSSRTLHLVDTKDRLKGHNKYKPSRPRASLLKDRDGGEDSDPEVAVKETIKVETEGVSKRHLMDMDMDDGKPAPGALPADWESVTEVKGKPDVATKPDSALDINEADEYVEDLKLAYFKQELQELLVLYSCNIPLKTFVNHYVQRYSRPLDMHTFGVTTLEALFQKVKDVAVLAERSGEGEAGSKEVYVVAV